MCNECFAEHVRTESDTDALDLLSKRNGHVFCPMRCYGCEDTPHFTDSDIAKHTPEQVFDLYLNSQRSLMEQRLSTEIEASARTRMEAERER